MGTPDYVEAWCPECQRTMCFQSKGGPELCEEYHLQTAPADVMSNINRHSPQQCDCGVWVYIDEQACEPRVWDGPEPPKFKGINWFYMQRREVK